MKIKAISISDRKGIRKKNIDSSMLLKDFGLEGDAHGGDWHRQVSFLAEESIEFMREKGLDVVAGNFAENITTEGINLLDLSVGTHIQMGESELIISQLGKVCHHKCAIYHQAGDCVMPREGIFGVVKAGGEIKVGDNIEILPQKSSSAAVILTKENTDKYGDELIHIINTHLAPGFVRVDKLAKDESNLDEILNDLVKLQKIDHIVLLDASKKHILSFAGDERCSTDFLVYTREGSQIYSCRDTEELKRIFAKKFL